MPKIASQKHPLTCGNRVLATRVQACLDQQSSSQLVVIESTSRAAHGSKVSNGATQPLLAQASWFRLRCHARHGTGVDLRCGAECFSTLSIALDGVGKGKRDKVTEMLGLWKILRDIQFRKSDSAARPSPRYSPERQKRWQAIQNRENHPRQVAAWQIPETRCNAACASKSVPAGLSRRSSKSRVRQGDSNAGNATVSHRGVPPTLCAVALAWTCVPSDLANRTCRPACVSLSQFHCVSTLSGVESGAGAVTSLPCFLLPGRAVHQGGNTLKHKGRQQHDKRIALAGQGIDAPRTR